MSSPIGRAAQLGLTLDRTQASRSRVQEIGKRDFSRRKDDLDDDDDDDDDTGEGYSIDPSVQLWKSIDFSKQKGNNNGNDGPSTPKRTSSTKNFASTDSDKKNKGYNPALLESTPTILHSSSVTSFLDNNSGKFSTSRELDDLHRALDELDFDKKELQRKANNHSSQHSLSPNVSSKSNNNPSISNDELNSLASELLRQKDELKLMMESIRQEKQEMVIRSQLLEIEKRNKAEEEERRLQKEREEFQIQLNVMKMQNEVLLNRMEQAKEESRVMLEQERQERQMAVAKMESENRMLTQQILESQRKAEDDLMKEKEETRRSLKRMEAEKLLLVKRMKETEDRHENESKQLASQRESFESSLRKLEHEKVELAQRVIENEKQSQMANEMVSNQLNAERLVLQAQLEKMEREKQVLAESIANNEAFAKEQSVLLSQKLEMEKNELMLRLNAMEVEKQEMAKHLVSAERAAQEQAKLFAEQLETERKSVQEALKKVDLEKNELEMKLNENLSQVSKASDELKSSLEQEREELKLRLEQMSQDKAHLSEKLKVTEEAVQSRELIIQERLAKEKDDLKQAVQRMKEELHAERLLNTSEGGTGDEDGDLTMKMLKPSKSLYALLEGNDNDSNNNTSDSQSKTLKRLLSKKHLSATSGGRGVIQMIPEGDESEGNNNTNTNTNNNSTNNNDDSFMDLDESDDENKKNNNVDNENDDSDNPFSDLPLPHAAAAKGDFDKLKSLAEMEPSLLSSFDSAHRSPLFYAVAYGNEDATQYLLEKCPEVANVPDVHGDFPLHAATSAGNAKCVEMLILSTEGAANVVNHMDMSPAHLACSVDCLEVLYKYGVDLSSTDCNGRSALFVACAMNREDCAEYLINCLDQDETSLLIKDNRGDTPLHAAACNGSVDCLLLLLQYGIDPTVLNEKGLKAIDLAIKNKQKKCRDLLAEYQLHFFTSSDFDSVLFWATLEGHRAVKQLAKDDNDNDGYNIIKKNTSEDNSSSNNSNNNSIANFSNTAMPMKPSLLGGLSRNQSMFSMKNKSLRLQKWGPWIAYQDQSSPKVYWYNHETSVGQWDTPEIVLAMQQAQMNTANGTTAAQQGKTLVNKVSMRLKRIGDWIQYITENGQTFYYNEKNGDFQWSHPGDAKGKALLASSSNSGGNTGTPGNTGSNGANGVSLDIVTPAPPPMTTAIGAPMPAEISDDGSGGVGSSGQKGSVMKEPLDMYDWSPNLSGASLNTPLHGNSSASELVPQARANSGSNMMTMRSGEDLLGGSTNSSGNFGEWRPYVDPASGSIFWYNQRTKESQWDTPAEIQQQIEQQLQEAFLNMEGDGEPLEQGDNNLDDNAEVFQVTDENDLGI